MKKNIETKKKKKEGWKYAVWHVLQNARFINSFILSFSSYLYACCLSNEINAYHPTATI